MYKNSNESQFIDNVKKFTGKTTDKLKKISLNVSNSDPCQWSFSKNILSEERRQLKPRTMHKLCRVHLVRGCN